MYKQITSALCASILVLGLVSMADAALLSRLGGQAFYDTQLDITWTADANINGLANWIDQQTWVANLVIAGVGGWRLPDMDTFFGFPPFVVDCSTDTQANCMNNEYGHLYYYGAGTTLGSGVTSSSPGPFSNVLPFNYWSESEDTFVLSEWTFHFDTGIQAGGFDKETAANLAWAVHDGDVAPVPAPSALLLFGTGLIGLIGIARRQHIKT